MIETIDCLKLIYTLTINLILLDIVKIVVLKTQEVTFGWEYRFTMYLAILVMAFVAHLSLLP